MTKRVIVTVIMCCLALHGIAGSRTLDSLRAAAEQAHQDTDEIRLLISLSQHVPSDDSVEKLKYAQQSLEIARKIKSGRQLMDCYQNLGLIYLFSIKNYRQAAVYYHEYERTAQQENDTARQIDALQKLMIAYNNMSEFAEAIECGNQALLLHPDQASQINILGNMGVIYMKVADYSNAMDYYTRSLSVTEHLILSKKQPTLMDTLQMAGLVYSIGDIYAKMQDYDKALDNYNRAISISKNYYDITIVALMGKGAIFDVKGNYAAATDMYKKALEISYASRRNEYLTAIFTSLSGQYFKSGQVQVAQKYADSALALATQNADESKLPNIYIILAELNARSQKYGSAVSYLNDAIRIAAKTGALQDEGEAWKILSNTYSAMKKPADAFSAYRHFIAIKDSIYNIEKTNAISRMGIESIYTSRRISDSTKSVKQAAVYEANMQKQQVLTRSAYGGVALLVLLSFFIYRNYSQQKKANILISKANEKINDEKQVSEALLRNILPEEVARELKANGDVQPKLFDSVTVLFTDFVNFTIAGDRLSPRELVAELHTCFKAFDVIIGKYNIEKIKTVGDAYIAVAGLPQPNASHATDTVNAALEIRDFMLQRKKAFPENTFEIRIGINSGPVVAGIVGVTKFAYDIWGDTVNVAARMEQYGEKGRVNISGLTYALVKNNFTCSDRGKLAVKNKGEMNMFFVERI